MTASTEWLLLLLALGGSGGAIRLQAQTGSYCSLVVRVTDPQGFPLVAKVTVTEGGSRRITMKSAETGLAEFCDLGIKPVEITVGQGGCDEVDVKDVELHWGRTRSLPLIYAPCWLTGDPPPGTGCEILLRFLDARGNPVPGAMIAVDGVAQPEISDVFGRLRTGAGFDTTLHATGSAPGFISRRLTAACSRTEPILEQDVSLDRIGGGPR